MADQKTMLGVAAHIEPDWTGSKDQGSQNWEPWQYVKVTDWFEANEPCTYLQIGEATKLEGRTVRSIMAASDGVTWVLYSDDGMLGIAKTWAQAQGLTSKLQRQVGTMQNRLDRRRRKGRDLSNRQGDFADAEG